ncbi:MAG: glycosyltransferase family 87 protein, partial [Peptococcaceae bacterium]
MSIKDYRNPDKKSGTKFLSDTAIGRFFGPCEFTPRISLFIFAVVIKLAASAVSGIAWVFNNSMLYISGIMLWILWFSFLFIIAIPQADQWLQKSSERFKKTAKRIIIAVLVIGIVEFVGLSVIGLDALGLEGRDNSFSEVLTSLEDSFNYNDATALSHQAAENFLEGKNPYAESNIVIAMHEFDVPLDKLTPLRLGIFADSFPYPTDEQLEQLELQMTENPDEVPAELESCVCYPAGSFLIPALFLMMGISDMRIIYIILMIPVLLYVIWISPARYRLLLFIIMVMSLELWNSLLSGETGFLVFPFLLLGWVLFSRNPVASAICIGLAATIKQMTWFFIPFYLILIYRTQGMKKAIQSLSIILLIFAATNLPFIISDPQLWFASITSPMTDKFPLGVGIITLVTSGLINLQSSLFF